MLTDSASAHMASCLPAFHMPQNGKGLRAGIQYLAELQKETSNVCENINIPLKRMMKTIRDLKYKFRKEKEILKRSQAEVKIELKNSVTQLENSRESLSS